MKALFCGTPDQVDAWEAALIRWRDELGVGFDLSTDAGADPAGVDVLIANPKALPADLTPYSGLKLIQSIWAGVEAFLGNAALPEDPPLCRMVEAGMAEGMTDYICGHVLRHHLGLDRHIADSAAGVWRAEAPPLSRDRTVGVLGLGELGRDAAAMLKALRFDVAGWSRSPKADLPYPTFHGSEGLDAILERSEIIVTILPNTPDTKHIVNAERLARLPRGAVLINPGRGSLIDDDALVAALIEGRVAHATLDVFDVEPLPADHPYWRLSNVTVTPHVAAETRVDGAARVVVEQIGRLQNGEPLSYIVDRGAGY